MLRSLSRVAFATVLYVVTASAAVPRVPGGGQTPALDAVLASAGTYLTQLGHDLDGVVFEEDYFQQAQGQALVSRRLKSDVAVLSDDAVGWVEFRDTTSVDGKPVRDRETRIASIFEHPSGNALEQAKRIVREGARFNIEALGIQIDRTINLPMSALMFLRSENQKRSTFSPDRSDFFGGKVVAVQFRETAKPRLVRTVDDAAAQGTFWIASDTGRVLRTRLLLETHRGASSVAAQIQVDYALVPSLKLWLPKEMEETYVASNGGSAVGSISGRAIYQNFRKFNVAVDEKAAQ